jgi:uncharacterized membrane protein
LDRLETAIAQRWLVWLGGLALGGLFLVGWAIDQGWLGARARITVAAALGLAERAWDRRLSENPRPGAVPAALSAGGLTTLYGTTLAAHLFYGLIGPGRASPSWRWSRSSASASPCASVHWWR